MLRTSRRRLAAAALLIALTAILGYLFNRTQAADIEAQNRVMLNLRELEKLDAEWDANILRAHIGRAPAAPQLTTGLPRMRDLIARVGDGSPMAVGQSESLTVDRGGRLYLGVNDDYLLDNRGEFRVTIDVGR